MKGHTKKLNEKLNYTLKEGNDGKLDQKEEKGKVLDLKERMDKTILKITTLKRYACLNIQRLIEENNEELNSAKENGTK